MLSLDMCMSKRFAWLLYRNDYPVWVDYRFKTEAARHRFGFNVKYYGE